HLDDEPQVGAVLTAILYQYGDRFGTTNIDFDLNDYFTFYNELVTSGSVDDAEILGTVTLNDDEEPTVVDIGTSNDSDYNDL
uniref:Uncharacterized protein n=1 Tax=Romanomermis culicivorax TaxID=13658 RepID=A0A915L133_ROMCU